MPLAYVHFIDSSPENPPPRPGQGPVWGGPVDPGFGVGRPPVDPGYGIGSGLHPSTQPLPPPPVDPDFGIGAGRPPTDPGYDRPTWVGHPSNPIYHPDKPTPPGETPPPAGTKPVLPPDAIYPPLPPPLPGFPGPTGWILIWVIGVGYRWLHAGHPDNTLPPTAQPRRG